MTDLNTLNNLTKSEFIELLEGIYEHAPWVAELTFALAPFDSVDDLHLKMQQTVENSDHATKHALICNHPELAGKEAEQGSLTKASLTEQSNSGLSHCSTDELKQFKDLNAQYKNHFGFPFVVAVKDLSRHDILDLMQQRLTNPKQQEFDTCIEQIRRIAGFRLKSLFGIER